MRRTLTELSRDFKFIITSDGESYLRDPGIRVCGLLVFLREELVGGG